MPNKNVHHSLVIAPPAGPRRGGAGGGAGMGWNPVSEPPGYSFVFGRPRSRMQDAGQIWFSGDSGYTVTLNLTIDKNQSPGFTFANDGVTNDGTGALWISDDPILKTQFNDFNGVFSAPTLSTPDYLTLTFTSANTGGLFYYQINVFDPNGALVTWDPIIVNQP